MKRKRYIEEQIISILKEHQAGASAPDLARRHSVVENTIYHWKPKYGCMEVSETRRLPAGSIWRSVYSLIPSSSTSKTRVLPGPITPPAPRSP